MNNAVGYTRIARFEHAPLLGTDGIGGNMFAELKSAWFISRHEHAGIVPEDIVDMLAASARRAFPPVCSAAPRSSCCT